MDHESAVERLYDLHLGRLDEPEKSELAVHLDACPDCRSFAETYRVLHTALGAEPGTAGEHPTSPEIVSLVYEPESIPEDDREAIEFHLARCRSCSAELSNVREVETSLTRGKEPLRPVQWLQPRRLVAIAASILVLALAYPAFLGLVRLPRVLESAEGLRQEAARLEESIADQRASGAAAERDLANLRDWSGTTPMQFVTSARRKEARPSEIVVRSDQPFVVLGIDVGIPPELADSERLSLEIIAPDGSVAVESALAVGEARSQILSTAVITFVVSSSLPPGSYELRMAAPDRADLEPFLEASVQVRSVDRQETYDGPSGPGDDHR